MWAAIPANLGLTTSIRKRVSEADDGNYVVAGALLQVSLYAVVAVAIWLSRPYLTSYLGVDAALVVIALLFARLAAGLVNSVLDGQHLVHVSSILSPVEVVVRSSVQIALVVYGFELAGAFAGYFLGGVVAFIVGSYFVTIPISRPERADFDRIISYAQFSWLSSVKGRTFMSMDTIVLGFFVANSVIAVYGVAWNLASMFAIFGLSIRKTLFPEISKLSSTGGHNDEIGGLLRTSLTYAGLFIVPGFVGSALLGDVVLTVYGDGFSTGYYILIVLVFARLLYSYEEQFVGIIDAIDRPELTFRINLVFVLVNLILNVALTGEYGWYGAAAATTISAGIALVLSHHYASSILDFDVPLMEISKQWVAAGLMALVVYVGRIAIGDSLLVVVPLAGAGAGVYFGTLLTLSTEFRQTVEDNLPVAIPLFDAR